MTFNSLTWQSFIPYHELSLHHIIYVHAHDLRSAGLIYLVCAAKNKQEKGI